MPKMRCLQDGNEHFEIDLRDCEIDVEMVESIYTTALSKLQIARQLAHMKLEQLKGSVFNFKPLTTLPRTQDKFLLECDSTCLFNSLWTCSYSFTKRWELLFYISCNKLVQK